ncbi:MAG: right-handed parallel beta-helix repeat-containing protein, partial [Planctomycetota bacterium]|nr:right-handed parallel beta-helix repeat-containing protein [Planctomycetota bacterium]
DLDGGDVGRAAIVSRQDTSEIAIRNGAIRNWTQGGVSMSSSQQVRLTDLRVSENLSLGISVGAGSVVTYCMAYDNSATGISVGSRSVVTACASHSNGSDGFSAGDASTLKHCASIVNGASGYGIGFACTLVESTAQANNTYGVITFGFGGSITDCSIRSNGIDGIRVSENWTVRGNNTFLNGVGNDGAGIRATGADNRIEANHCYGNDYGLWASSAGNLIIANTARSNNDSNFRVVADNVFQSITAVTGGVIAGNSGGASIGSANYWMNFAF